MNAYEAIYQKQLNEIQRKIMVHQYGAIMDNPSEYQDHMIKQQQNAMQDELVVTLQKQLAAAMAEADAMEEFLSAAAKREKEASAIIESLAADIHITVPLRDYTEMSPKDCYELGMMDGVAALKSQIKAVIDAAMKECGK